MLCMKARSNRQITHIRVINDEIFESYLSQLYAVERFIILSLIQPRSCRTDSKRKLPNIRLRPKFALRYFLEKLYPTKLTH